MPMNQDSDQSGNSSQNRIIEEQFRLIVEAAAPNGIVVSSRSRLETQYHKSLWSIGKARSYWSTLRLNVFGYGRDELVGQPIEILVPERLRTHTTMPLGLCCPCRLCMNPK